ncbi:MAG: histidine phosphatase family protein [Acidobacteriota bacterium]|nr:histidine phosphatase family protein [Acidobacteriota bacterium]MDE3043925.1 histidine phosphatase family protein [Acidobacteriota bacterium]MDE3106788.1 histidine phosphatase family protein [Acidobacteriota bacterium]MDE3222479.1 histidine phosphatase family protein [Acidobacteriota bacterium]
MIIFIRHGQTTTNAQGLLVGRSDPDLTAFGERQAVALREALDGVQEVWTSPLSRARRTAALALPHLRAVVNDAFIEVDYGHWDGRSLKEVSGEQWRAFEHDHDVAFDGGESLAAVDARVHNALDALLADAGSYLHRSDEHLAIVSHVSPIKSATTWALGVSGSVAWRTRLDNASLTTIGVRSGTPSLVRFNAVVPVRDDVHEQRSPSAS